MLDFIKGRSVVVHLGFKAHDNNSDSKKKKAWVYTYINSVIPWR